MIVTCDPAKIAQLALILPGTWRIKLCKNNLTPGPTNVVGDFVEADFTGYVDVAVGSWTIASTVDGSDRAVATAAIASFTASADIPGGQICYCYYVVDAGGALVFSERLSTSANFVFNGDQLQITPTYKLGQI